MRMHNFWAQNGPFPQMRNFFRKAVNQSCFITASFPPVTKDGNNNSFPQIHLHNTNAFFEDLTGKHFYN